MNDTIRFVLDGDVVTLRDVDPTRTVLQYLREDRQRTGTKEGCAEGDCGACTVVVAELSADRNRLQYRAINSCIQFLPTLDGKELITVESLTAGNAQLHPVQRALVDCHGSQCGFCTPGFVMSLFAVYKTQEKPSRKDIDDALAGNLCRCTGYRPIIDAAAKMYEYGSEISGADQHWMNCSFSSATENAIEPSEMKTVELLRSLTSSQTLHVQHDAKQYFAPTKLAEFARLVEKYPDACILAGGTDVGLWVTKLFRDLNTVLYIGNVRELQSAGVNRKHIDIGASVTLSDAMPLIIEHYPDLEELFLRFGSPPIRNAGTLGGNIANGSPIGDTMPVLIVIGTTITLRKGSKTREIPLDEFYLDYQKTAIKPGEFVERIRIPLPIENQCIRTYKVSKRFDQDISAVCGAYALQLKDSRVDQVRVAYGGVATTPKRAAECEKALLGKEWSEKTVRAGMAALDTDYSPIGDMRASKEYRQSTTRNLLYRFWLESSGFEGETNVYNYSR